MMKAVAKKMAVTHTAPISLNLKVARAQTGAVAPNSIAPSVDQSTINNLKLNRTASKRWRRVGFSVITAPSIMTLQTAPFEETPAGINNMKMCVTDLLRMLASATGVGMKPMFRQNKKVIQCLTIHSFKTTARWSGHSIRSLFVRWSLMMIMRTLLSFWAELRDFELQWTHCLTITSSSEVEKSSISWDHPWKFPQYDLSSLLSSP